MLIAIIADRFERLQPAPGSELEGQTKPGDPYLNANGIFEICAAHRLRMTPTQWKHVGRDGMLRRPPTHLRFQESLPVVPVFLRTVVPWDLNGYDELKAHLRLVLELA